MSNGRTAICPGSYDPVTNGHLDIIGRAAQGLRPGRRRRRRQPAAQGRRRCSPPRSARRSSSEATADLDNVEVEVFSILLVEFAREQGATAIVKGLRAISDFEYEFEMNQLNRKLAPEIESVYVIASPELQLPLLDRGQGDGDLRRRRLATSSPGVAKALTERIGRSEHSTVA